MTNSSRGLQYLPLDLLILISSKLTTRAPCDTHSDSIATCCRSHNSQATAIAFFAMAICHRELVQWSRERIYKNPALLDKLFIGACQTGFLPVFNTALEKYNELMHMRRSSGEDGKR